MMIHLKPCGPVAGRMKKIGDLEVEEGINLLQLKTELGIPKNYPVLYAVNNTLVPQNTVLKADDRVTIINIFAGG